MNAWNGCIATIDVGFAAARGRFPHAGRSASTVVAVERLFWRGDGPIWERRSPGLRPFGRNADSPHPRSRHACDHEGGPRRSRRSRPRGSACSRRDREAQVGDRGAACRRGRGRGVELRMDHPAASPRVTCRGRSRGAYKRRAGANTGPTFRSGSDPVGSDPVDQLPPPPPLSTASG